MKKAVVCIFVCMLVGFSAVAPTSSLRVANTVSHLLVEGNTLYVGGSGPNNYTKIQDAINDSTTWDTVFVYDDSSPYNETLTINKSISLVGENKETTVIESTGNSTVVTIAADLVSMSGFTVIIHAHPWSWGVGITISKMLYWPNVKDEIIQNVTLCNTDIVSMNPNSSGILGLYCNSANISNTSVTGCSMGIQLFLSSHNRVTNNVVENCSYGIYVSNTWSPRYHLWFIHPQFGENSISRNIIRNNQIGIFLDGDRTKNDRILENTISNNEKGILLGTALKSEIARNNFIGNDLNALLFTINLFFYPTNSWHDNYWGKSKKLPVPIFGVFWCVLMYNTAFGETNFGSALPLGRYPVIAFDRTPAQEPYEYP